MAELPKEIEVKLSSEDKYVQELINRDTAKKVEWEVGEFAGLGGRISPTCGHRSYYCCSSRDFAEPKQPDNFCSKCGQGFVVE